MTVTNISQVKAQLSALLEKVQRGEEIIIGKAGKPIAKIIPFKKNDKRRKPGALKGKMKISKDFDETPKEVLDLFGIK
ncbi:MAG: type II toxin-antitoxin system Phd/YefM family antitoxin [Pseudomonadota bacterium]